MESKWALIVILVFVPLASQAVILDPDCIGRNMTAAVAAGKNGLEADVSTARSSPTAIMLENARITKRLDSHLVDRIYDAGLSPLLLSDALAFARMTLEKYPPDKFLLLDFGLTATLNSAFIRELMPADAGRSYLVELPVIGKHYFLKPPLPPEAGYLEKLNPDELEQAMRTYHESAEAQERKIVAWFDRVTPQLRNLRGRDVVMVRALMAGGQADSIVPALLNYATKLSPSPHVNFNLITGYGGWSRPTHLKKYRGDQRSGGWHYTNNQFLANSLVNRNGRSHFEGPRFVVNHFHIKESDGKYSDFELVPGGVPPPTGGFQFMSGIKPFEMTAVMEDGFRLQDNIDSQKLREIVRDFISAIQRGQ